MVDRITETTFSDASVNPNTIMSLFLYGTLSPPAALYDRIKTESYITSLTSVANQPVVVLNINAGDYLTTGAGRFARAAEFQLVQAFFAGTNNLDTLAAGTYSYSELNTMGFENNLEIQQVYRSDGGGDDATRPFIYNNTSFRLNEDGLLFVVNADGTRELQNVQVRAYDDNFDFEGGSLASWWYNFWHASSFDPYGIGTRIEFDYDNSASPTITNYSENDFAADGNYISSSSKTLPVSSGANNETIISAMKAAGVLLFEINNFGIIYGTFGSDTLSPGALENSDAENLLVLAGEGDDLLVGWNGNDRLYGHEGNDNLIGYFGDDTLIGGSGNDVVDGGFGNDVIYGDHSPENYLGAEESNRESFGADTLTGGSGNDVAFGGGSNDWIEGGPGLDSLYGGDGDDTLDGQEDVDV
ncbi:MAG: hypothetical protein QM656_00005, partial [Paracoccaceae bacterium]